MNKNEKISLAQKKSWTINREKRTNALRKYWVDRVGEKSHETIICACGCGEEMEKYDDRRRPRKYKHGHNGFKRHLWGITTSDVSGGYRRVYMPNHPYATNGGFILEHRLVMENYLGRYLKSGEVVHHIDKDRANNNIENLMLFVSDSAHQKYHKFIKEKNE